MESTNAPVQTLLGLTTARHLECAHENEITLEAEQRSHLSQRWANFCRDVPLIVRLCKIKKDSRSMLDYLLTWNI